MLAPIIQVTGGVALPANTNGLTVTGANSSNSTIRGLVINGFDGTGSAIRFLVSSANNVVIGNYLGTNAAGTAASANGVGVFIQTSGNRVGGPLATDRNIISGNTTDGIQINGGTALNNLVQNNYICLDVNGTADLGNSSQGVAESIWLLIKLP